MTVPDRSWQDGAACYGMDVNLFYAVEVTKEVKDTCKRCPVFEECERHSLRYEIHGFWAGMTEEQREQKRRKLGIKYYNLVLPDRRSAHGSAGGVRKHKELNEKLCMQCDVYERERKAKASRRVSEHQKKKRREKREARRHSQDS